jgi:hypothetical protein
MSPSSLLAIMHSASEWAQHFIFISQLCMSVTTMHTASTVSIFRVTEQDKQRLSRICLLFALQPWRQGSKILWNIKQFLLDYMATHILWLEYHLNELKFGQTQIKYEKWHSQGVKNTNITLSLFTSWPDNFCLVLLDFWILASCWVWTLKWTL